MLEAFRIYDAPTPNKTVNESETNMENYVIHTDTACDIRPEILDKWGVKYTALNFRFTDEDKEYRDGDMPVSEFYSEMRGGRVAKTSAINSESFKESFTETLKAGLDVLYLGFSSGLSTTYNTARLAAEELREEYPKRKIITVDTLAASAGEGLIVYLASEKKKAGATIEELRDYVESIKLSICHWFTVDDLVYLKRGGRINAASAFFGNLIGIKPVLHVDNDGHLIAKEKVRGRRTALAAIAQKYSELATTPESGTVFICQADCKGDAEELARMLNEKHGREVQIITDVGPVIGAHSGPGTIALFFIGKER